MMVREIDCFTHQIHSQSSHSDLPNTNLTLEPVTFQDGQSEIVSLGPNSLQTSVRLFCTVAVSGSFQWTWLHNSNPLMSADRYQILTADATRSSILVIDKLSYTDEGTYSCVVNHATQADSSSRVIVLRILSKRSMVLFNQAIR